MSKTHKGFFMKTQKLAGNLEWSCGCMVFFGLGNTNPDMKSSNVCECEWYDTEVDGKGEDFELTYEHLEPQLRGRGADERVLGSEEQQQQQQRRGRSTVRRWCRSLWRLGRLKTSLKESNNNNGWGRSGGKGKVNESRGICAMACRSASAKVLSGLQSTNIV